MVFYKDEPSTIFVVMVNGAVLLTTLKLTGYFIYGWGWVFAPIWIPCISYILADLGLRGLKFIFDLIR